MAFPVVLLGAGSSETRAYFAGAPESFHVHSLELNFPVGTVKCPNPELKLEHQQEITGFLRALSLGDLDQGLLLIRDSAITLFPVEKLAALLRFLRSNHTFDLLYLGRYLDRCDLYTPVGVWEQLQIMATTNSNGSFALYLSPRGVRRLQSPGYFDPYLTSLGRNLSGQVFGGRLLALTTEPPIFTHRVENERDWVKTHTCKIPTELNQAVPRKAIEPLSFWWFLLIVLGIIVLALMLWPRT